MTRTKKNRIRKSRNLLRREMGVNKHARKAIRPLVAAWGTPLVLECATAFRRYWAKVR